MSEAPSHAQSKPNVLLAIIGGSGLYRLEGLVPSEPLAVSTPFGEVTDLQVGEWGQQPVVFLPRHGQEHRVPPHQINYRANIWALKSLGVTRIVAVNAVGSMQPQMPPGSLVVPEQLIDYTYGRAHTFADSFEEGMLHVDFSEPFTPELTQLLNQALKHCQISAPPGGVYACTQGPRLETAAEIRRLRRDGCDLVGMTAMPEAALARELSMHYASLCSVVNWAAGCSDEIITMAAIQQVLESNLQRIQQVLRAVGDILAAAD